MTGVGRVKEGVIEALSDRNWRIDRGKGDRESAWQGRWHGRKWQGMSASDWKGEGKSDRGFKNWQGKI